MPRHRSYLFSAALLAASALPLAIPGAALAQSPTTLNAAAYHPVDRAQAVSVAVYGTSAEAEDLARRLEEVLRRDGWTVRGDAPLRLGLTMTTSIDSGDPDGDVLAVDAVNRDSIDTRYKAEVRVYSSRRTSLVGGAADAGAGSAHARVQLDLTAPDGTRLWDGWATTALGDRSPDAAAAVVLPALVEAIGRTVRAAPSAPPADGKAR